MIKNKKETQHRGVASEQQTIFLINKYIRQLVDDSTLEKGST